MSRRILVFVALLAAPAAVQAQATPEGTPFKQVISVQPLGIPALFFSGEYEGKASPNVTLGAGGSYFSPGDVTYASVDAKVRYYPNAALKGFEVGATAGFLNVSEKRDPDCSAFDEFCGEDQSASGATLGIQLDYQWLLGRQKKFAVALGAGMKRFLGTSDNVSDFTSFYPTARASIGWAF